jgi:hypothetical protein
MAFKVAEPATNAAKKRKQEPTKKLTERMFDCVSDGLSRPVDKQSKGALMLAKMACAGSGGGAASELPTPACLGLGRSGQGRAEPIPIHLEGGFIGGNHRAGLGLASEVAEVEEERAAFKANQSDLLKGTFLQRSRDQQNARVALVDLRRAQKALQSIEEASLEANGGPHQSEALQQQDGADVKIDVAPDISLVAGGNISREDGSVADVGNRSTNRNGHQHLWPKVQAEKVILPDSVAAPSSAAEAVLDGDDGDAAAIVALLEEVVAVLRQSYSFCMFCGISFNGESDMAYNCPGPSRLDHDD